MPAAPSLTQDTSLREIAHEIRQPLSAIESIAYYLMLVLPRADEKVQQQLARVRRLVEQSDWILSNGIQLSESIEAAPELVDFEALLSETTPPQTPRLELAGNLPMVRIDPQLGRALIANLVTLARQCSSDAAIRTSVCDGGIVVEMEVAGSLAPGSTLSLNCARRIAEVHGGTLDYTLDPASGIRVRVMLP